MTNTLKTLVIRLLAILIISTTSIIVSKAHAEDKKTLLILNSYSENESWINSFAQPLILKIASIPQVDYEMISLNNAVISDSLEFKMMAQNLLDEYDSHHPDYVVMFGNLAFNLRQQVKERWGDIPMLLITPFKEYALLDEYFSPEISHRSLDVHNLLNSQRSDYNFTAIIIPEYYKQTVDMMVGLIPKMDKFVYMSDTIFANRKIAREIQTYIREEYPGISFVWLKASDKNAETFKSYLVEPSPNTGLLLSTWLYNKKSINGTEMPTTSDFRLVSASRNPIFSLHESYMVAGCIGGVYADPEPVHDKEIEVLEAMMGGVDMRDIPIYVCEESFPCINYRRLIEYNLSEDSVPEGTVFLAKPASIFERYFWQIISIALLVMCIFVFQFVRSNSQKKRIEVLNRNQEFVNNMPVPYSSATVRYDTDNRVVTIAYTVKNQAFEKILEENVVENSPFLLFPANFIAPKVTQLLKDGKMQVFVYHFDKTDTYYEFILCLVHTKAKRHEERTKKIDVFAIDITKRHKMEAELTRITRKLDIAMSVSRLISWQYDIKKDTIIYDSYVRQDDFKYVMDIKNTEVTISFNEFLNRIHIDDRSKMLQIRKDLREGSMSQINVKLRRLSEDTPNEYLWYEMFGVVTEYDEAGRPTMLIGSYQDIDEVIRHQEEMALALARANESDRMKSTFLASMSHEIRTPLNAIVGFSNVIAHSDSEDERLEFCDIINKSNEQLLALINDVLDLAKIESNTIDINFTETDINQMMDHIHKSLQVKIPENVKFNVSYGAKSCVAELDQNRVTQILNNFVSNSCKFTPNGSINIGYEVTDRGMIYFYVRDTGIGIDESNREKIFDRFTKLNTFIPGTGLGLSICKNLVEKMGGEIGVDSPGEGKGSTFWFTIPYIPVAGTGEALEDPTFFKTKIQLSNNNLKVLIAEDNESNYKLLSHLLKNHFSLLHANNGEEAVKMFMAHKPDIVLMDISMPGMDGYVAFREIRKMSAKVPIIAVTAYVYGSDRSKILKYGFNGYVSKPITQKAIIDAIAHSMMA